MTPRNVRVTWVPGPNPPAPVVSFNIYAEIGHPDGPYTHLVGTAPGNAVSAIVSNLPPGVYNLAVTAVDGEGQESPMSPGSNAVTVLALPPLPHAPSNVGAEVIP